MEVKGCDSSGDEILVAAVLAAVINLYTTVIAAGQEVLDYMKAEDGGCPSRDDLNGNIFDAGPKEAATRPVRPGYDDT